MATQGLFDVPPVPLVLVPVVPFVPVPVLLVPVPVPVVPEVPLVPVPVVPVVPVPVDLVNAPLRVVWPLLNSDWLMLPSREPARIIQACSSDRDKLRDHFGLDLNGRAAVWAEAPVGLAASLAGRGMEAR
jgi:hypothetical protein